MSEFNSIVDFFSALNKANVCYLVMRNYENMLEPEIFVDGHGDIDLLCDDYSIIVNVVNALPFHVDPSKPCGDGIHYKIFVDGKVVSLDLRQVGDGYYCEKWERDLLDRRKKHECFYVMNQQDYFFTLVYHSILQKRCFSHEYKGRLSRMADTLGVIMEEKNENGYLRVLEAYMKEHGYMFTYSKDYMVPNRFSLVSKSMIEQNIYLWWKHLKFENKIALIALLVKIKHSFRNCFFV